MSENIEYKITWEDIERRAQQRPKIALAVDDEADQRELVSTALQEMDTFFGNDAYFAVLTQFGIGVMAEQTPNDLGIFVASTHEAGLHAALTFAEAGAAPTILAYDINIMGDRKMNGVEAALDVVALSGGKAPVVFFTAYNAAEYSGFKNTESGDGIYYIVQKSEGTERLKIVIREAQYCADVRVVLDEVRIEKEHYLARLTKEVEEALKTALTAENDVDMISRDLEAICDRMGDYETFAANKIHDYMHDALAIVETVKTSSTVHPLGEVAVEQTTIDQKIEAKRQGITAIKDALEAQQYDRVAGLVERLSERATADTWFYEMLKPDWGKEQGTVIVLGDYVLERLEERVPGGVVIKRGESNIEDLGYRETQVEQVIRGVQMLLVAGERALREVGLKGANEDVEVTVDAMSTDDNLSLTLRYNIRRTASDTKGMRNELEAQLGFNTLGQRLLEMAYVAEAVKPRIEATYNPNSLSIKVELSEGPLMR
jgi:CheY-like chemotaxis protein